MVLFHPCASQRLLNFATGGPPTLIHQFIPNDPMVTAFDVKPMIDRHHAPFLAHVLRMEGCDPFFIRGIPKFPREFAQVLEDGV
mmetsp:Transcript_20246/g.29637  ORF Transcript_20246/g.29637 Transcript_20246/m.29637 type:complete len:84 (+) Transcript_20246:140-391(+)